MSERYTAGENPALAKINRMAIMKLSTTERDALVAGDLIVGMLIYNTTVAEFQRLTSTAPVTWAKPCVASGGVLTDTHAASLTGSATMSVSLGFQNLTIRSATIDFANTTENTAIQTSQISPTSPNLVIYYAEDSGSGAIKITNAGDITMRMRQDSSTGTILESSTATGVPVGGGVSYKFIQGIANKSTGSTTFLTLQASTNGVRAGVGAASIIEVDLSDTHAAGLTGTASCSACACS